MFINTPFHFGKHVVLSCLLHSSSSPVDWDLAMTGTTRSSRRHSVDVSRTLATSSGGGGGGYTGNHHRQSMDDPFASLTRAPTHESPDERALRLELEELALRRNREIDEGLAETKKALERRGRAIKVLLLGQAESGKSTTLRSAFFFAIACDEDYYYYYMGLIFFFLFAQISS